MKREFLGQLQCPDCRALAFRLEVFVETDVEVREGSLRCGVCGRSYRIEEGIANLLPEKLPEEVAHEKKHAESFAYIVTEKGEKHPIHRETIQQFRHIFLSLPEGDGSHYFRAGGSFSNQSGNAKRFFRTLDLLKLTGRERVLEVGASFGWAAWRFAQRGCHVTAVDITDYLKASDLYFETGCYFERIMADMSSLPFRDGSYDLIFSHSVIHHCKDLVRLFREFYRVLAPGGRVVALHECAFGIFEDKSGKALQEAIHEGFNENAYTLPQWVRAAKEGGFAEVRTHLFSFIDDYIDRKALRGGGETLKLRLARWVQKRPLLHQALNTLSIVPRILLRPKAWMIVARRA